MARSRLEDEFAAQIKLARLPEPQREFRFIPPRKFRFDFAWPSPAIAIEIEGGIFAHGRHTRGVGFARDCEKHNLAVLAGWRVLRVTAKEIRSGQALRMVEEAMSQPSSG